MSKPYFVSVRGIGEEPGERFSITMCKWFYMGIVVTAGSLASAATIFSWHSNTTGGWTAGYSRDF